ncbi:MAG: hypothetical protein LBU73_03515 [Helicobacteraceae bacterium]|jgi:hypothetical protein|nr:hypothetical protein [Helicobacteraceae bacterium]
MWEIWEDLPAELKLLLGFWTIVVYIGGFFQIENGNISDYVCLAAMGLVFAFPLAMIPAIFFSPIGFPIAHFVCWVARKYFQKS